MGENSLTDLALAELKTLKLTPNLRAVLTGARRTPGGAYEVDCGGAALGALRSRGLVVQSRGRLLTPTGIGARRLLLDDAGGSTADQEAGSTPGEASPGRSADPTGGVDG